VCVLRLPVAAAAAVGDVVVVVAAVVAFKTIWICQGKLKMNMLICLFSLPYPYY
jgi:hypothetical protein